MHHPPPPDWERQRVRNDDSEVIEIRYGGVSFVFTGDIGREVEHDDRPHHSSRRAIRILKVPHHGSATSSSMEFLRALRPDIAVISDGRGNPYGHPVPAVARALSRHRRGDLSAPIWTAPSRSKPTGTPFDVRTFTNRRLTLRTTERMNTKARRTRRARRHEQVRCESKQSQPTRRALRRRQVATSHRLPPSPSIVALGPGFVESVYRNALCVEFD